MSKLNLTISLLIMAPANTIYAELQSFDDFDQWAAAISGEYSTMDFTGFPDDTHIDEQYADLGAHFTTLDIVSGPSRSLYPNDGWGLNGFQLIIWLLRLR